MDCGFFSHQVRILRYCMMVVGLVAMEQSFAAGNHWGLHNTDMQAESHQNKNYNLDTFLRMT